jgi:hypothetical protein
MLIHGIYIQPFFRSHREGYSNIEDHDDEDDDDDYDHDDDDDDDDDDDYDDADDEYSFCCLIVGPSHFAHPLGGQLQIPAT